MADGALNALMFCVDAGVNFKTENFMNIGVSCPGNIVLASNPHAAFQRVSNLI